MAYTRPDFEAQFDPPEWLDFGDSEQSAPNVSPFVDALKKRMSRPKPTGSAMGGAMGAGLGGGLGGDMALGKATSGGGGPKSL